MMEDSNFSETPGGDPSNFILLPSQQESQQESQDQMVKTLKRLPALQDPGKKPHSLFAASTCDTQAHIGKATAPILVPDSEYESVAERTGPSDYISESEDVSEGPEDVTVIQKDTVRDQDNMSHTHQQEHTLDQSPTKYNTNQSSRESTTSQENNDSSVLRKTRSTLQKPSTTGSVQYCGLQLFASSQDDMFAESLAVEEADIHVSTPSEHIASLHISQHPMLVPETLEMDNAIPPSQDAYDPCPTIIPDSPTKTTVEDEEQYDVLASDTMAESNKDDMGYRDSPETDEEGSCNMEDTVYSNHGNVHTYTTRGDSRTPTSQELQAALAGPTMREERPEHVISQSLHLHLTESTQSDATQTKTPCTSKDVYTAEPSIVVEDRSATTGNIITISTESEDVRVTSPIMEEVIVIHSGTLGTQQEDDSQQLMLRLSPSQPEMTSQGQGHNSQKIDISLSGSRNTELGQKLKNIMSQGQSSNSELPQGQLSQKGHTNSQGQQMSGNSRSQGESEPKSQGQRSSSESRSQGQQRSSGERSTRSEKEEKSLRRKKKHQDVDDKPLVVWENNLDNLYTGENYKTATASSERFSGHFHLSLPKEGSLIEQMTSNQPKNTCSMEVNENASKNQDDQMSSRSLEDKACMGDNDHKASSNGGYIEACIPSLQSAQGEHRSTQIGEPDMDSEQVTQPVFRLERPDIQTDVPMEGTEDTLGEDIFRHNKHGRQHGRRIILDDSDDDISLVSDPEVRLHDMETGDIAMETSPEILIAKKIDLQSKRDEYSEVTQPYDPEGEGQSVVMETDIVERHVENVESQHGVGKTVVDVDAHSQTKIEKEVKSILIEMSTQTQESLQKEDDVVSVDMSVCQKVSEYLQSAITPQSRSRSSSGCTDTDLHIEALEKGLDKGELQTPQKKDVKNKWKSPISRQQSMEVKKSPIEIQNIIKTYSNILAKKRSRRKSKSDDSKIEDYPNSQNPNSKAESKGPSNLLPRRLSIQSLPSDLRTSQSKNIHQSELSNDPWMTARKPHTQLSVDSGSEQLRDKSGVEIAVSRQDSTTGITQDLGRSVNVDQQNIADDTSHTEITLSHRLDTEQTDNIHSTTRPSTSQKTSIKSYTVSDDVLSNKNIVPQEIDKEFSPLPSGTENLISNYKSQGNKSADGQTIMKSVVVLEKLNQDIHLEQKTQSSSKKKLRQRATKKAKKLLSSAQRSRRRSVEGPSPDPTSGSFVASTQKFRSEEVAMETAKVVQKSRSIEGHDHYTFHNTQSQRLSTETTAAIPGGTVLAHDISSSSVDTPLVSRKHKKIQHKKSGLKKARTDTDSQQTVPHISVKPHVSFQGNLRTSPAPLSHDLPVSQGSDVTTTTSGSLPSIPSSISQSSPAIDMIMSPPSSRRQSVQEEITSRLSGKRMSIEQALPDTIPLQHSEEDSYQRVTIVTETIETVYREIKKTRKTINSHGVVLDSSTDIKKLDPVIVEESTHKKVQWVYTPSPSRSVSSLTSGDLGDISSSLSRSSLSSVSRFSNSSGSLRSKVDSIPSSLDPTDALYQSRALRTQISVEQNEAVKGSELSAADVHVQPAEHIIGKPVPRLSQEASGSRVQELVERRRSKPTTPGLSDQEHSDVNTPLGSTINKTGDSYLHSRTTSVESPKVSQSLFTSSDEKGKQVLSSLDNVDKRKFETVTHRSTEVIKQSITSDRESPRVPQPASHVDQQPPVTPQVHDSPRRDPQQEDIVSSSSPPEGLVPSSGAVGSRVISKWKDGFYYPGTIKSSADRYSRCHVRFDDGDSRAVKLCDVLMIERLPVGQSVMVLTDEGDFVSGLILVAESQHYLVETDEGNSDRYSHSQVILTGDQASCVISDVGSQIRMEIPSTPGPPTNVGDVRLENLIDAPRRSAKKQSPEVKVESEDKGQGQKRGRKRKIDELKPQATSTLTPKGKHESLVKRKKGEGVFSENPLGAAQSSPVSTRRSPRKTRVGLFTKSPGPIPTQKLFKGMYFLLTNVDKTSEQKYQESSLLKDSSLETSTDESNVEEETYAVFDKHHLKAQIEAGGGTILDKFDEKMVARGKKRCVLLSSSYQRTVKYLMCLAAGVPTLSHMWVVDSCSQGRLMEEKSYILAAGISLEKRKIMESKKKNDIFIGVKAVVHSTNLKFVESWMTIMQLGQSHVHKQLQYTDVHVIVTDNTCSSTIQSLAKTHHIPLVSTEWVIQSLVNGRTMSYTGHPRYKHDFII